MKTRDDLIRYADGMSFESAWRAYAGMVEGGECTMEDLRCIKPELYRMVESHLAAKRLESKMIRLPGGEHRVIGDEELKQANREFGPTDELEVARDRGKLIEYTPGTESAKVLDWLADHFIERTQWTSPSTNRPIWERGPVRVVCDDNQWEIDVHTPDRAKLIRWQMAFSDTTPAAIVIAAIDSPLNRK